MGTSAQLSRGGRPVDLWFKCRCNDPIPNLPHIAQSCFRFSKSVVLMFKELRFQTDHGMRKQVLAVVISEEIIELYLQV